MKDKNIVIVISQGIVVAVEGLPFGYTYQVQDDDEKYIESEETQNDIEEEDILQDIEDRLDSIEGYIGLNDIEERLDKIEGDIADLITLSLQRK